MKSKTIVRSALALSAFFAPVIVFATTIIGGVSSSGDSFLGISFGSDGSGSSGTGVSSCASTICSLGYTFLSIINTILVPLLFAVSFIVFLYGIANAYIFNAGEPAEVSKGHKLMLWGIIGFAVMISVWGLVNIVSNTFGLGGAYAPDLPQSY